MLHFLTFARLISTFEFLFSVILPWIPRGYSQKLVTIRWYAGCGDFGSKGLITDKSRLGFSKERCNSYFRIVLKRREICQNDRIELKAEPYHNRYLHLRYICSLSNASNALFAIKYLICVKTKTEANLAEKSRVWRFVITHLEHTKRLKLVSHVDFQVLYASNGNNNMPDSNRFCPDRTSLEKIRRFVKSIACRCLICQINQIYFYPLYKYYLSFWWLVSNIQEKCVAHEILKLKTLPTFPILETCFVRPLDFAGTNN